ncbi:MAG TPA: TetR/AcrR family transcriptional regulator [Pseudonocardia sp.]|uniref:TetR/AcrR family transcriptional regulator n=1 Tax=Pseudonocardia sp. TaxID=60912 RepID=UPI002C00C26D|nr:TetR/AcrR family transcriptional regulator [Pseudonocardia sp.]HTF52918.1 TetR/AcrR family transcriptional regulator [Pseudonocardia sp.]
MSARRQPVSRRDRPAKPALTREWIIETAVRVMRAEGLSRVTMRRLATELDTGPASLYVYVANTAELHAAILEEMLGEVDLTPAAASGDWREQVDAVLGSYSRVLDENPGLARSALVARPSGPNYLNLLEALLALLGEGGVPDAQAAWGVDILLLMATASVVEHGAHEEEPGSGQEWDSLAAALEEASPASTPRVAALGAQLLSGAPPQRRAWAIRVLLDGMQHTPTP